MHTLSNTYGSGLRLKRDHISHGVSEGKKFPASRKGLWRTRKKVSFNRKNPLFESPLSGDHCMNKVTQSVVQWSTVTVVREAGTSITQTRAQESCKYPFVHPLLQWVAAIISDDCNQDIHGNKMSIWVGQKVDHGGVWEQRKDPNFPNDPHFPNTSHLTHG